MHYLGSFQSVLAATLLTLALMARSVLAQEVPPANVEEDGEDDDVTPLEMICGFVDGEIACEEVIVVTGTRLPKDPATRVIVITAQEIAERGMATTEEIIRSIPQNFATLNSFTNTSSFASASLDVNLGTYTGLGVATANLRGLGSRNTLVLVNNRRVAGAAGTDGGSIGSGFIANIRNIPAAAISHVEVLLDGAGAVYGSDAVGGVINIILKEGFTGVNVTGHYEDSATGGDHNRISTNLGYSWEGGNFSAVFSRDERDPVNNHKTGYTTRDYRSRFGGEDQYYFVSQAHPRAGVVRRCTWYRGVCYGRRGVPLQILPQGNDGRNAQPGDFVAITPADDYRDIVDRDAGGATEDISGMVNFYHTFWDKLTLRGEVLWQESETVKQETRAGVARMRVPASNAFNNFGEDVEVSYDPQAEVEAGLIKPGRAFSTREHRRYLIGFDYEWRDTMRLIFDHVDSVSDGFRTQYVFADPNQAGAATLLGEQEVARLRALLASSDPSQAPNFFGDGSGQNPTIADFYLAYHLDSDRTYTRMTTGYFQGDVFNAPGGRADIAIGGEVRQEWIQDRDVFSVEVERLTGVAKPTRDLNAAFVEAHVPLIDSGNERPGVQKLSVTVKARWDRYETEGSAINPSDQLGTDPNNVVRAKIVKATFSNVSPHIGIAYRPINTLTVRISHAAGFTAPYFRQLFNRNDSQVYTARFGLRDPLIENPSFANNFGFVPGVLVRNGSNPDLKPELSTTLTAGFEWTPTWTENLHFNLYYSNVDIRDLIASLGTLQGILDNKTLGNLKLFYERDENGKLIKFTNIPINLSRRASQALDMSVSKTFQSAIGEFFVELNYNRVLNQYDQAFDGSEKVKTVGRSIGVDRYKTALHLRWTRRNTTVTTFLNYTPSYVNDEALYTRNIPPMKVSSWTTLDIAINHRFDNGITMRMGGRDLLGKDFPFMLTRAGVPWDAKRVNLRGRVLFLDVSYDFGFGK